MSAGPLQRKAVMALLRDKKNSEHCFNEANAYTQCLASTANNHALCLPARRCLDFCMIMIPDHDRAAFKRRRSSVVQDLLRTSRRLAMRK